MNELRKIILWTGIASLAVSVGFYLILVLINLKDENLRPGIQELLSAQPPQIEAKDNGYFAWIGNKGPEREEPQAWGQRWHHEALDHDKAMLAALKTGAHVEMASSKELRTETLESKEIPCDKIEICLELVAADPNAARSVLQKGRLILERGDKAMAFVAYQEPWRPDSSIVSSPPPSPHFWRGLAATRFALAVAEGRHDEALAGLAREISFHARQMEGSTGAMQKMTGMANLQARYTLLSQYMVREPVAARRRADRIVSLLASLPKNAVNLRASLQDEERIWAVTLLCNPKLPALRMIFGWESGALSPIVDVIGQTLLLTRTTINEMFTLTDGWLRADGLTGDAYRQAITDARAAALRRRRAFVFIPQR